VAKRGAATGADTTGGGVIGIGMCCCMGGAAGIGAMPMSKDGAREGIACASIVGLIVGLLVGPMAEKILGSGGISVLATEMGGRPANSGGGVGM
jgi:hypothetical protein